MLTVLRNALEQAQAGGDKNESIQLAETLLGERAYAIAQFCGKNGTTPGKTGLPVMRKVADARWAAIQQIRREITEAILRLTP